MEKIKIIEFDRPNKNGRTYIKSEMNILPDFIPVMSEAPDGKSDDFYPKLEFPIKEMAGSAKPSMENDGIYVELNIYDTTAAGQKLINLLIDGYKLVSGGTGGTDDGIVKDYRIVFIFPVSPENNAWTE